jgi:hypothetical protein
MGTQDQRPELGGYIPEAYHQGLERRKLEIRNQKAEERRRSKKN